MIYERNYKQLDANVCTINDWMHECKCYEYLYKYVMLLICFLLLLLLLSCLRTVKTKPNQENLLGFEAVTAAGDLVVDAGAGRL